MRDLVPACNICSQVNMYWYNVRGCCTVAFRVYDLDNTGDIQPGEVKRLLVALLHGNPEMALDDATIEQIVDQVHHVLMAGTSDCRSAYQHHLDSAKRPAQGGM